MPSFEATVMNVISAGSLASTSNFEENMSTLIDSPPSSNISITNSLTLSSSSSSSSTSLLSSSSSSSSSLLLLSPSTSSLSSSSSSILYDSTDITSPLVISHVDDKAHDDNIVGRGDDWLTTKVRCGNGANSCNHRYTSGTIAVEVEIHKSDENYNNDDTVNKKEVVKVDETEDEDEGYASGDESIELVQHSDQVDITGLLFGSQDDLITMEDNINNVSYINDTTYEIDNITASNKTYVIVGEGMYPSGYSVIQIILASIAATILMIVVVVGNMLVIIAIATEKALKNIQNWFIASLAVADFFLGLIIIPFSLANEIMGYWIFGYWWCDIYSAMDVLLCTASIMNLCLISLDRFWSITQAVDYLKKRTPARAALMIALVWLLSALICIPPLLGWKRPAIEEEYPKCQLSEDIGYVLYSALGSFYIPSCIMVFVYIRIYYAAKARARRGIRKQPRPRPAAPPESPDIRQTSFTQSTTVGNTRLIPPGINIMENVATIESQPVQIPIVTCDFASDVSTSEADAGGGSSTVDDKDTLKVSVSLPMQKTNLKATLSVNGSEGQSTLPARCRAPSVGIDVDMVSEFDPSSSDSGVVSRCAVVKPLKLRLCRPIFGRKSQVGKVKRDQNDSGRIQTNNRDSGGVGGGGGGGGGGTPVDIKPVKPRDPEREKRRLARKKEKRATLILGLIMGSFIACWLPFFFLYIVKPLFPYLRIPGQAFVIAFWLGYINSALNPVIYTVFNKDFRRAFRRILYK